MSYRTRLLSDLDQILDAITEEAVNELPDEKKIGVAKILNSGMAEERITIFRKPKVLINELVSPDGSIDQELYRIVGTEPDERSH